MLPNHLLGYDVIEVRVTPQVGESYRVTYFKTLRQPHYASTPFDCDWTMACEIALRDPFNNLPLGTLDHKRRA